MAEHKSRLLDGRCEQTISPEARWHYRGARSGPLNRGASATSFRACPSRARDTLDKPRVLESAKNVSEPRRVRRAREGSVRAPTWTRDKPVKARGSPVIGRERQALRAPAPAYVTGNRGAVSATLVRLSARRQGSVARSGNFCGCVVACAVGRRGCGCVRACGCGICVFAAVRIDRSGEAKIADRAF
jgi:hypothetical protein